jgi:hypothetical protein
MLVIINYTKESLNVMPNLNGKGVILMLTFFSRFGAMPFLNIMCPNNLHFVKPNLVFA